MPLSPGFPDYVLELIAGFGKVEVKRMFGGAMLSRGSVGFAIYLSLHLGLGLLIRPGMPWPVLMVLDQFLILGRLFHLVMPLSPLPTV